MRQGDAIRATASPELIAALRGFVADVRAGRAARA
jgi:hypothetical protein